MSGENEKGPRPLGERLLAAHTTALEMLADSVRRGSLMQDRIRDISEVEVGTTPSEVVYEENKLELHRYESLTDEQHEVPILIVYAMVNQPYILDLQPDRSVVRRLLEAGHDVYLLDWNEPSRLDQHLELADYIERYIGNSVDAIRDHRGAEAINILGYCQGARCRRCTRRSTPRRPRPRADGSAPVSRRDRWHSRTLGE